MARPLPISARLALWYALTLLLLLSAFAVFCYAGFHAAAHRSFDRHLEHELGAVKPLVRVGPDGRPDASALDGEASVATRLEGPNGTYVRVLSPSGGVVYQSRNFDGAPPLGVELGGERAFSRTWVGGPIRTLIDPLRDAAGNASGFIEVSGVEWGRHRELRELGQALLAGVLLSALVALGAGWWLARRALRPVAVLTEAADRMATSGSAAGRLPSDFRTRDELTALAETFNRLLARLEASVERERRFTSNAAHELLTPIATLRSEAEVALRREREPAAYREALGRVVQEAAEMTGTVQGLLHLARAESLTRPADGRLDLGALVRQRVDRARPVAEARGVALTVDVTEGVRVAAEAAPLAEVVDNLVSNAVKYTPPGGRAAVRLVHAEGVTRLEVTDTGAGFDAATGERLFDRFFRADTPEVQAEPGSGLGLAIVKAVVEGYGGTAGCTSGGPGCGATFWAELPCLS